MSAELEVASPTYARELTDRIKTAVEGTWHLIREAYLSRAWQALGYESWDDYCTREFGTARIQIPREERTESLRPLRDAGLSLRAIESATGYSSRTIRRSLAGGANATPDNAPTPPLARGPGEIVDPEPDDDEPLTQAQCEALDRHDPAPEPKPTLGIDGKTYRPRRQAAPTKSPASIAKKAMDEARSTPWAVFSLKLLPDLKRWGDWFDIDEIGGYSGVLDDLYDGSWQDADDSADRADQLLASAEQWITGMRTAILQRRRSTSPLRSVK